MKKHIFLILVIIKNVQVLMATTSAENFPPAVSVTHHVPVYRVEGATNTGKNINGILVFSGHGLPEKVYLPYIDGFAPKNIIMESDRFRYETYPQYHSQGNCMKSE